MPADPQGTLFQPPAQAPPAEDLVGFRSCSYDLPFWVRSNTRAQRWNLPLEGPTQYWSCTPDGAWAEHIRFNAIMTEAELDDVRIPMSSAQAAPRRSSDLGRLVVSSMRPPARSAF
ncbi:MAG: hypothetical protein ACR2LK_04505 [Solirubrobacteraceae bacterium]